VSGDRERVPNGKGFMGNKWDRFVPPPAVWDECYRVLKPGGYMAVFAGSRTADLMGLSIRLAGFEMRDTITWMYGNGFPKSLNIGKAINKSEVTSIQQWEGWGTALKPASEPIIVARKPFLGTVAANVLEHGTGGMNIDGCRVSPNGDNMFRTRNTALGVMNDDGWQPQHQESNGHVDGRWPANVVLSHTGWCDEGYCEDGCPVAELDAQSGQLTSGKPGIKHFGNNGAAYGAESRPPGTQMGGFGDTGGASRFFNTFRYQAKAPKSERPVVNGVAHPTVKPRALMEWLVTLFTPTYGTVLDPFTGSGTTGEAALRLGFNSVVMERDQKYWPLIDKRLGDYLDSLKKKVS
jgi:site-specific DNA-methyltransferase (adenine-specific)